MKISIAANALALAFSFLSLTARADGLIQSCKVTRVLDSNVLEESLSVDEYPEVTVENDSGAYVIQIGANHFSPDSEFITEAMNIPMNAGSFGYQVRNVAARYSYSVFGGMRNLDGKITKVGQVVYSDEAANTSVIIAELICK